MVNIYLILLDTISVSIVISLPFNLKKVILLRSYFHAREHLKCETTILDIW